MKDPLWVIEFKEKGIDNLGAPQVRYINPQGSLQKKPAIHSSVPKESLPSLPSSDAPLPDLSTVPVEEVTEKFLSYLNKFFLEFIEYSQKMPVTEAEGDQYAKELYKNLESLQKWMDELKKITDNDDEFSSQDPPEELK